MTAFILVFMFVGMPCLVLLGNAVEGTIKPQTTSEKGADND